MTKLGPEQERFSSEEETSDFEEIEILEVVGLDEDAPPTGARAGGRPSPEEREARRDHDEVILDFDAEEENAQNAQNAQNEEQPERHAHPTRPALAFRQDSNEPLLRLQADFENFKKRVERERRETEGRASAALIERLLPVLDNFERAVATSSPGDGEESLRSGVCLIFKQLLEELRKDGLSAIDSVGQAFDPRFHDAVATEYSTDLPPNTVTEELQRGYLLKQSLLRPALVKVCLSPVATEEDYDGEDS